MNEAAGDPRATRPPREPIGRRARRHFLTGILVVTPAAVAAWVLYQLLSWVDGLLWDYVRFGWVRPGGIPGVGLVTVVLLVFLVGFFVNQYIGRRFYQLWDSLLSRIPLFNKIYTAVKQIGDALFSNDTRVFRAVGMIEYPRPGVWSVVFLTEKPPAAFSAATGEDLRSVFLPTSPNPTSGYLLMVPERDIQRIQITVEEGIKMVISGGAYVPGRGLSDVPVQPPPIWRRIWDKRGAKKDEPPPGDDTA
jgi:uncharacterized membrane protein